MGASYTWLVTMLFLTSGLQGVGDPLIIGEKSNSLSNQTVIAIGLAKHALISCNQYMFLMVHQPNNTWLFPGSCLPWLIEKKATSKTGLSVTYQGCKVQQDTGLTKLLLENWISFTGFFGVA